MRFDFVSSRGNDPTAIVCPLDPVRVSQPANVTPLPALARFFGNLLANSANPHDRYVWTFSADLGQSNVIGTITLLARRNRHCVDSTLETSFDCCDGMQITARIAEPNASEFQPIWSH
ncbi:hypothetical protein RSSM_00938 [Rhodopirellula sallentina SM41]|uniref:Uncharacterized protein n=1 Tax=Rhodopirellula sallentina SM41 TaxID=1263870 RepID=M5U806_9BACT|nr:hypothetical protein RSSM_00938 [Rhodopirellula sallentina SM41]